MGDRTDASLRKLLEKVDDGKCFFVTDDWAGFRRNIPEARHFVGKDLTFPIESTNSDLRHRVGRFHRRSKITSRSIEMVHATIKLFEYFQNPKNISTFIDPFLSFFS